MSCCAIARCGRQNLTEPAPGLEFYMGKWSCTLCFVNPTRFAQPVFKKFSNEDTLPMRPAPLALPEEKKKHDDLFGEEYDD